MTEEDGDDRILVTVLAIIIVGIILGCGYKIIMGRDGFITKASSVEIEYDKGEISIATLIVSPSALK